METNHDDTIDSYQKLQKASSSGGGDQTYTNIAGPIDEKNEYEAEVVPTTNEENKYDYPDFNSELANDIQHSKGARDYLEAAE